MLVGNLWTDPLGRLWLIFDQSMDMFDGRAVVWVALWENPDAEQPTWSAPRRLWHGVTLNKPTVLSNGEWMLPISLDQREGTEAAHQPPARHEERAPHAMKPHPEKRRIQSGLAALLFSM